MYYSQDDNKEVTVEELNIFETTKILFFKTLEKYIINVGIPMVHWSSLVNIAAEIYENNKVDSFSCSLNTVKWIFKEELDTHGCLSVDAVKYIWKWFEPVCPFNGAEKYKHRTLKSICLDLNEKYIHGFSSSKQIDDLFENSIDKDFWLIRFSNSIPGAFTLERRWNNRHRSSRIFKNPDFGFYHFQGDDKKFASLNVFIVDTIGNYKSKQKVSQYPATHIDEFLYLHKNNYIERQ